MPRALVALIMAIALLAAPAVAHAQSAGDEQYVDPFQGGDGGGQEEPAPPPEQPAEPAPAAPAEPAPGGDGAAEPTPASAPETEAEAEATQSTSPTLPRTGAPVVLLGAIGYGLLVAGIAIRRKA